MKVEWLPSENARVRHAMCGDSALCFTGRVAGYFVCAFYRKFEADIAKKIPRCKHCEAAYEKRFGKKVDHDA